MTNLPGTRATDGVPTYLGGGDPAGLIPQARVKIYPDAAHGFLFQHHAEFARDIDAFLRSDEEPPGDGPGPHADLRERTNHGVSTLVRNDQP
jgi:hypothetical protein